MTVIQSLPRHGDVFLDARDGDRALRVAWHPDADLLVLSMWRNGRCVATSQLGRADVGGLIGELGMALATAPSTGWTVPRLATVRRSWPRWRFPARRVVQA